MIEPARAATILRWHALTATAAITVTFAAWLGAGDASVSDIHAHGDIHLGVAAPLWLLTAWQLILFRRRTPAPRALAVAALCAIAAGAAAIGAELHAVAVEHGRVLPELDWIALLGFALALAAAGWMIATCVGLVGVTGRLAAGTLHLPSIPLRDRALRLQTACVLIPWSLMLAFAVATFDHPVAAIAIIGIGVLALLTVVLAIADLLAKSRELPTARIT